MKQLPTFLFILHIRMYLKIVMVLRLEYLFLNALKG